MAVPSDFPPGTKVRIKDTAHRGRIHFGSAPVEVEGAVLVDVPSRIDGTPVAVTVFVGHLELDNTIEFGDDPRGTVLFDWRGDQHKPLVLRLPNIAGRSLTRAEAHNLREWLDQFVAEGESL